MSFKSFATPGPMIPRLEFRLEQAPESVSLARVLNSVLSEKTKKFFVHIYQ
ncbi:hypothetical protein DPMN_010702 [Dreissena polymorpha]|uniref:Uncharacterized protein n=1 Tax=Dreissena polymorpha TaxID=45954 RepID=A0A9D4N3N4_DREPO|nr:hypothetical protein DPMN_010702 [Dreissena polymorpha]